jgi:hypothetical protein
MSSPKTHTNLLRLALPLLATAALFATGCSNGSMSSSSTQGATTGPAFVIGTDAPLASVVSFPVEVESVVLTGATNSNNLVSGSPTVDFARFNGLQTLIDMNDIDTGSYTGVNITLGAASIGYLNTGTTPYSIATMAATYPSSATTYTVSIPLDKTLTVATAGTTDGLRMDFDLAKSIAVDGTGAITGAVTPTIDVHVVSRTDQGGHIDTLIAGVLSVNSGAGTFVVQGPHGEQFNITTNGNTDWDGGATIGALNTSSIVEISGSLDPADQTLDADEIAILADKGLYATGQITNVTPATGAATSFNMYVRAVEPANTTLLGNIADVTLTGSEKYYIYWFHNPFTQFLFNSSALVAGQDVGFGGSTASVSGTAVTNLDRIHLRNWGFNGTIVAGSQSAANGTFQMKVTGFAGVLIPETITVYPGTASDFRYGLGAFTDLTDGTKIRVVGLLLKNPTNGNVVLLARHCDGLSFTDYATAAY